MHGLQVTKALLEEGDKFEVYALVRDEERARKAIGADGRVASSCICAVLSRQLDDL